MNMNMLMVVLVKIKEERRKIKQNKNIYTIKDYDIQIVNLECRPKFFY